MESNSAPSPASEPQSTNTTLVPTGEGVLYCCASKSAPLRQGEILSGLVQRVRTIRSLLPGQEPEIAEIEHPFAMVLSQDCDLLADFEFREKHKWSAQEPSQSVLPNVLFCEAVTISELLAKVPKGTDIWKRIRQNKDERYHVLESVPLSLDVLAEGIPALGIDFRRYFSVPTDEIYTQFKMGTARRSRLISPYLEHFTSRFAAYLSRVALPRDHMI